MLVQKLKILWKRRTGKNSTPEEVLFHGFIEIHGLKEEKNKRTNDRISELFEEDLSEDVLLVDLDKTHRIRQKKRDSNSKPSPVIVKFAL